MDLQDLQQLQQDYKIDQDLDMQNYDQQTVDQLYANAAYQPALQNLQQDLQQDQIKPEDALIIVGCQNGDFSQIQVYIYQQQVGGLYVHHDFMINAYPLALQWIPFNPLSSGQRGNAVIIGSFLPQIEIWDLDLKDPVQPVSRLGGVKRIVGKTGKKRKKTVNFKQKTYRKGSHRDAILCMDLHPLRKQSLFSNLLATGSADTNIKIWDLLESKCKISIQKQSGKVQSVNWNPQQEKILATGGIDGFFHVFSVQDQSTHLQNSVPSQIESIHWNPFNPVQLAISTQDGYLSTYDARNLSSPLVAVQAHQGSCRLDYSPGVNNLMATASSDGVVKLWNASTLEYVAERPMNAGKLFSMAFYQDSPFSLAAGGTEGILSIWDTEENSEVSSHFKWIKCIENEV